MQAHRVDMHLFGEAGTGRVKGRYDGGSVERPLEGGESVYVQRGTRYAKRPRRERGNRRTCRGDAPHDGQLDDRLLKLQRSNTGAGEAAASVYRPWIVTWTPAVRAQCRLSSAGCA